MILVLQWSQFLNGADTKAGEDNKRNFFEFIDIDNVEGPGDIDPTVKKNKMPDVAARSVALGSLFLK